MLAFLAPIALLQAASAAAPPPKAPPTCEGEAYAAFDFWVGEWDVYSAASKRQVARSRVEKLYGGCAIRENWYPKSGQGGGSLSGYDPATGRWHQTWIGSSPGPVFFDGGPAGGKMVLTGWWKGSGPNGEDGLTRMTYSQVKQGAVRQHGEFSGDHGLTWQTSFDLIYRPHKESE